jgi:hypothetical protein
MASSNACSLGISKDDSDGGESSMCIVQPHQSQTCCVFGTWNRERRKARLYFLTYMYSFGTFKRNGDKRLLELTWN